eukprot:jgi/Chrzof1/6348/Cz18g05070.t1
MVSLEEVKQLLEAGAASGKLKVAGNTFYVKRSRSIKHHQHELRLYKQLNKLQGSDVPVCFGEVQLEDGRCFIVLEYVPNKFTGWTNATHVVSAIHLVQTLHQQGLLLVDIKPEHFRVRDNKRLVYMDFDLSIWVGTNLPRTSLSPPGVPLPYSLDRTTLCEYAQPISSILVGSFFGTVGSSRQSTRQPSSGNRRQSRSIASSGQAGTSCDVDPAARYADPAAARMAAVLVKATSKLCDPTDVGTCHTRTTDSATLPDADAARALTCKDPAAAGSAENQQHPSQACSSQQSMLCSKPGHRQDSQQQSQLNNSTSLSSVSKQSTSSHTISELRTALGIQQHRVKDVARNVLNCDTHPYVWKARKGDTISMVAEAFCSGCQEWQVDAWGEVGPTRAPVPAVAGGTVQAAAAQGEADMPAAAGGTVQAAAAQGQADMPAAAGGTVQAAAAQG